MFLRIASGLMRNDISYSSTYHLHMLIRYASQLHLTSRLISMLYQERRHLASLSLGISAFVRLHDCQKSNMNATCQLNPWDLRKLGLLPHHQGLF